MNTVYCYNFFYCGQDSIAWTDEGWSPDLNAHTPYHVTPERVKEMRKSEGEWFRNGSAVARFTQMLRRPHKSRASHLTYDVSTQPSGHQIIYCMMSVCVE